MFRIRFHGRGGQGMKTASRVLGSAFFLEGFEVQDAPRYGAERRGAPIFAYVRAAREPVTERGIIRHPQLVLVADETLVPIPAAGVLSGVTEATTLLLHTSESPETWKKRLNTPARILELPTPIQAEESPDLPLIGAACAGAAAQLIGAISQESLEEAIRLELSALGTEIVRKNIETAIFAYESVAGFEGTVTETEEIPADAYEDPGWIDLPFEEARISTPAIHAAGTSEGVNTGLWRTLRPIIDLERCHQCWWICSTFCPDSAILVNEEGYPQIDYDHCKGCMICVAQCPPHAIEAVAEHEPHPLAAEGEAS
jgi:pyruvate ferredoxin oxidoreductase gamma subunit